MDYREYEFGIHDDLVDMVHLTCGQWEYLAEEHPTLLEAIGLADKHQVRCWALATKRFNEHVPNE